MRCGRTDSRRIRPMPYRHRSASSAVLSARRRSSRRERVTPWPLLPATSMPFASEMAEGRRLSDEGDVESASAALGDALRRVSPRVPAPSLPEGRRNACLVLTRLHRPHSRQDLHCGDQGAKRPQRRERAAQTASSCLNYLDLTGNALIRLDNPTVYLQAQGAPKEPNPPQPSKARVQGPKAGRLIRLLVDVRPPYGVRNLAAVADLAPGYVSRLLDTLDDEALVERSERGRVVSVDIGRLVRRWVEAYDVFRANKAQRYLAPAGAASALDQLRTARSRAAVTGSFAAGRIAPVAAPALLAVYVDDPRVVVNAVGLIPADQGANVVLLTPFDPVVWERTSVVDGLTYVAPSQAAADCLTGNGRMPAEGDALLQWMTENESLWRLDTLPAKGIDG